MTCSNLPYFNNCNYCGCSKEANPNNNGYCNFHYKNWRLKQKEIVIVIEIKTNPIHNPYTRKIIFV